jgi:hypothetical protein
MRRLHAAIAGLIVVVAFGTLSASRALAGGSIDAFTIDGNPGSWLLETGSVVLDDSNTQFSMSGYNSGIEFSAQVPGLSHWWYALITPPTGGQLTTGTYQTLRSADATHGGLDVFGDGRGCNQASGTLTITEFTLDPSTQAVTAFAASYQQACELFMPIVSGEIRWHSTVDYVAGSTSPASLDFGNMAYGTTSAAQTVTVSSLGSEPLQLGAATIGGGTPDAYEVSSDGCAGQSLTGTQTCLVSVIAHPTAGGQLPGTLLIPDNSTAGFRRVALTVNSTYPNRAVSLSASNLPFGLTIVGTSSAAQSVTLTSTGNAAVTIGAISIAGTASTAFHLSSDNCSGATLAPNQTCVIAVTSQPTAVDLQTAYLRIPDNTVAQSSTVYLSVTGVTSVVGEYYPLSPARILDTRSGNGALASPLGPDGVLPLQVAGRGGVAATGVSAVVLNVTAVSPTASSYLTVYPSGTTRPVVSNLNFPRGWVGANNVTVPVGADGKVDIYNLTGSTHVVADVLGFYAADNSVTNQYGEGGQYQPVTPERLLDTRQPPFGQPLPGGYYVVLPVDYGDINPHIRALAVNVTATGSTRSGFLTTWNADPNALPTASTLNFTPHTTVANLAVVPVRPCDTAPSCAGFPSIGVYNGSNGSVHVIVDIVGFFDDGALGNGLFFHPVTPTRITDTRVGLGSPAAIGPKATAKVTAPSTVVDASTVALAANLTAVAPTASTYLSVWPADTPIQQPLVSTLNASAGQVVPNAALITIGPNAAFNIFNSAGNTNVLVDVAGVFEFQPASTPAGVTAMGGGRASLVSHLLFTRPEPLQR